LVRLRFQRKGSPRISHTLWIARYVSVEADGVVIGDDDHSDRARRTCDMRRFSPDELVTLRLGLIKLRAAKIWLVCARPPTRAAQKVAARNRFGVMAVVLAGPALTHWDRATAARAGGPPPRAWSIRPPAHPPSGGRR